MYIRLGNTLKMISPLNGWKKLKCKTHFVVGQWSALEVGIEIDV